MEAVVRIGESVASGSAGDTLACEGLGSCIGLALYDRSGGYAALAHVMLPQAPADNASNPGRYADRAVPALVEQVVALGASRSRLEAVIVGGAAIFSTGAQGQDIGARNTEAVTAVLEAMRIPVRASDTGGRNGRTIRIRVGPGMTTFVRAVGGRDAVIFGEAGDAQRRSANDLLLGAPPKRGARNVRATGSDPVGGAGVSLGRSAPRLAAVPDVLVDHRQG